MNNVQNARRPRGRGQKRNKMNNGGNRNGHRAKGNAKQLIDRYRSLARDAQQTGDRVLAEYYLQHADHYQRVLNERYGVQDSPLASADGDEEDEWGVAQRPHRTRSERAAAAEGAPSAGEPRPSQEREHRPGRDVQAASADQPALAAPKPAAAEETEGQRDAPERPPRRRRPARPSATAAKTPAPEAASE